jgi:hypothetical protein
MAFRLRRVLRPASASLARLKYVQQIRQKELTLIEAALLPSKDFAVKASALFNAEHG